MIFNIEWFVCAFTILVAIFIWLKYVENLTQFFILAVLTGFIVCPLCLVMWRPASLNSEISEDISELSGCMLIVSRDSYLSHDNISLIRRCAIRASRSLEKAVDKPRLRKIELLKFDVEIDTIQAIIKPSHGNLFK